MEALGRYGQIFEYICKASSELNNIFAVPVLLILATKLMSVVASAFGFIFSVTNSSVLLRNSNWILIASFIQDSFRVLIVLTAADLLVRQVVEALKLHLYMLQIVRLYFIVSGSSSSRKSYCNVSFILCQHIFRKNCGTYDEYSVR